MMINKVVQTKRNNHLYGADESPSVRAVPPHLFFISLSLHASLFLSLSPSLLLIVFIPFCFFYIIILVVSSSDLWFSTLEEE